MGIVSEVNKGELILVVGYSLESLGKKDYTNPPVIYKPTRNGVKRTEHVIAYKDLNSLKKVRDEDDL